MGNYSHLHRDWIVILLALLAGCGLSDCPARAIGGRPFHFPADAPAITNETKWIYRTDPATGGQVHHYRTPPPTYSQHCFVLARTAKQFQLHARFNPLAATLSAEEYRVRTRAVLARSPRLAGVEAGRIEIPGFTNLHEFSATYPALLRHEAGGAWRSYLQRGNWRMILPFTRKGQDAECRRLMEALHRGDVSVVHLTEFPRLRINHAVLFYDVEETPDGYRFMAYDPNDPHSPLPFRYRRGHGFNMPPTPYFLGGPINVYEIYRSFCR